MIKQGDPMFVKNTEEMKKYREARPDEDWRTNLSVEEIKKVSKWRE